MAAQQRIRDALAHPRLLWVVVLWALILSAPSLGLGLVGDDLPQAKFLTASREGTTSVPWWDMFVLVDGVHDEQRRAEGALPWWTDPELRVAFFRPLSVATHQLDHRLWPDRLWAMHLHSMLWYACACALAWLLARRLCTSASAAGLAALVYASAFGHLIAVSWLAHRNALVSAVFSLLTIHAHDRWRRDGSRLAGGLAPLWLAASLLAGEAGVVTLACLFAHAVFFDEAPLRRRLLALLPSTAVVIAWRALYRGLGYGVVGSSAYLDPISSASEFLAVLPQRWFALLSLSASPPFIRDAPPVPWWAATLLLMGAALVFVVRVPNRAARFGAVAAIVGIVPLTASVPFDRLLVLTSFGVALLWGELLDRWLLSGREKLAARAAAGLVVAVHLVISPIAFVWRGLALEDLQPDGQALGPREWMVGAPTVVLVHTPNYLIVDELARERSVRLWVLHAGPEPPIVDRVDPQTLELRSAIGWPGDTVTAFWRNPAQRPFVVGEQIETEGYVATVQEVDEGKATRVRFRFRQPIDDPSVRWVFWRDGMHRVTNPRVWR